MLPPPFRPGTLPHRVPARDKPAAPAGDNAPACPAGDNAPAAPAGDNAPPQVPGEAGSQGPRWLAKPTPSSPSAAVGVQTTTDHWRPGRVADDGGCESGPELPRRVGPSPAPHLNAHCLDYMCRDFVSPLVVDHRRPHATHRLSTATSGAGVALVGLDPVLSGVHGLPRRGDHALKRAARRPSRAGPASYVALVRTAARLRTPPLSKPLTAARGTGQLRSSPAGRPPPSAPAAGPTRY